MKADLSRYEFPNFRPRLGPPPSWRLPSRWTWASTNRGDWTRQVAWVNLASRQIETPLLAVVRMSRSRCCNTRMGIGCMVRNLHKSEPNDSGNLNRKWWVHHGDVFFVVCAILPVCSETRSVKNKSHRWLLQFEIARPYFHFSIYRTGLSDGEKYRG